MALWQACAALLAFVSWVYSAPASLADAARREALRRQLVGPAIVSLTDEDVRQLPYRPRPEVAAPAEEAATPEASPALVDAPAAPEPRDETWWRSRMAQAREALERDRLLAEALQSRLNALTMEWSARDDPAQRQQLDGERTRVLDELDRMLEQVAADREAIARIEEEARRQNVPPGWLR